MRPRYRHLFPDGKRAAIGSVFGSFAWIGIRRGDVPFIARKKAMLLQLRCDCVRDLSAVENDPKEKDLRPIAASPLKKMRSSHVQTKNRQLPG